MDDVKAFFAHPAVVRVAQFLIGALMLWSSLTKLGNIDAFVDSVHNFRLVPVAFVNFVAMTLPWVEFLGALALIGGVKARGGAFLVLFLLVVFTIGVAQAMARGLDFECGCFGTNDGTRVGMFKILQNVGLILLAWLAALRPRAR